MNTYQLFKEGKKVGCVYGDSHKILNSKGKNNSDIQVWFKNNIVLLLNGNIEKIESKNIMDENYKVNLTHL